MILIIKGKLWSLPPYRSGTYMTYPDKQDDDDENVVDNDDKDDDNCNSRNKTSCIRQPCKQGSASEPIERTA